MSGMGKEPWRARSGKASDGKTNGATVFAPDGTTKALSGPRASAIKYDILTALLVTCARGNAVDARLALRLSLLITARFNWRQGTFNVGQREMARMWGVTERTAKREMAQMRAKAWIAVSVPAARGRVAQYRIQMDEVLRATTPHWEAIGPDFVARMTNSPPPVSDNVVPMRTDAPMPEDDGTIWPRAAERLNAQDPAVYSAWLSALVVADVDAGTLILIAPSPFIAGYVETHYKARLLAAVLPLDSGLRDVQVIAT